MAFGYGYSSTVDHRGRRAVANDGSKVKTVFDSAMVAHVWAQQTQDFARNSKGVVYFSGRRLFSYGTHYVVGLIMPDGLALLNSESNSVTTNGHRSTASGAVGHKDRFKVNDLTRHADLIERIADGEADLDRTKRQILDSLHDFTGRRAKANQPVDEYVPESQVKGREVTSSYVPYHADGEPVPERHCLVHNGEGEAFGEYLLGLMGARRSWPRLVKERAALDAKAAKEKAAKARADAKASAIKFADMTDSDFRASLRVGEYHCYQLKELATSLYRSRRVAKAEGLSDKRRATLLRRERQTRAALANFDVLQSIARKRRDFRMAIVSLPSFAERLQTAIVEGVAVKASVIRTGQKCFNLLAASERLPIASRNIAANYADALGLIAEPMESAERQALRLEQEAANERRRVAAIEHDEKAAQSRIDWMNGADVRLYGSFDAPSGGAAMRIHGDELQTSHGAQVPLAHAVKVFAFVKLCRERGTGWSRNGRTIRVGHFQVDSVSANGDFRAGCHIFTWTEVERVAALAGVADVTPDDSALIPSREAA